MKIFVKTKGGKKTFENLVQNNFPELQTIFHDPEQESYFTINGSNKASEIGWLINVSQNTNEFLYKIRALGRFRIDPPNTSHPNYFTLSFENEHD